MRTHPFLRALTLLALLSAVLVPLPARAAEAPPIHLIKDLGVNPGQDDRSEPRQFTFTGNKVLFTAETEVSGRELWVTDGTAAGTAMVKDIEPGGQGSAPEQLTRVGNRAYFLVHQDDGLRDLWVSDGSSGGTVLVKAGFGGTEIEMLQVGSELWLFTQHPDTGLSELWKTNGTLAGTTLIHGFDNNLQTVNAAVLGADVIFSGFHPDFGYELWITDGTSEGTDLLKDLHPDTSFGSAPEELVPFDGRIYFRALDPVLSTFTLWKTDGTEDGTVRVEDPATTGPGQASELTVSGGQLFFHGRDDTNGAELWVSDGTVDGTHIVEDITSGDSDTFMSSPVAMGGDVYFLVFGSGTVDLWVSDGTEEGTQLLDEVAGGGSSGAGQLTAGNGKLYFYGDDGGSGAELWSSDGTVGGAQMIADLEPSGDSFPHGLMFAAFGPGEYLFFGADGPVGDEPYVFDETTDTSTLLKDIQPPSSRFNHEWVAMGGSAYFPYNDGVNGTELWKTNGTASGTGMVKDINDAPTAGSHPEWLTVMNGVLYFVADNGNHGMELWRSDGTEVGTTRLEDLRDGFESGGGQNLTAVGNTLYFVAIADGTGFELFKTNGSAGNAAMVADLSAGDGHSFPEGLAAVGSELWFSANDGSADNVYRTSGGAPTIVEPNLRITSNVVSFGGSIYFSGDDGSGRELWKSNGTPAGTSPISNQSGGAGSFSPRQLTVMGTALYFFGNQDGSNEDPRLYKTTGTQASTTVLSPGSITDLSRLQKLGTRLVFTAREGSHGDELWTSNGTAAGTKLVKDIGPGDGVGEDSVLSVIGKAIYFAGQDGTHGEELWVTDGTAANTFMVQDFNPFGSTGPRALTRIGSKIVFNGLTVDKGRELLGLIAPRKTTLSLKVTKTRRKVKASGVLNPAHTGAPVSVTLYKRKNGRFVKVATKRPASNSAGAYATSFRRQSVRRCKITARYAGHVDHLPSSRSVTFRC